MKKYISAALAATVVALPGLTQANESVLEATSNPSNWAIWGGNYAGQRYSELEQINTDNVGKLQVAYTFSTGVLRGHEGGPLVVGDKLYVHSAFPNKVFKMGISMLV